MQEEIKGKKISGKKKKILKKLVREKGQTNKRVPGTREERRTPQAKGDVEKN